MPSKALAEPEPLSGTEARIERNEMMVALLARGVSQRQVAATFGVSIPTVKKALADFRATEPKLREHDPLEVIDMLLEGFQADLEELALLSASAKSDMAKVGAINARMVAREKIQNLLQSTGVLPHDLGKLKVEVDVRYIAMRLVAVLMKHQVPEGVQRELLDVLGRD